jgi:ATP-binding cassette subfamily B protein
MKTIQESLGAIRDIILDGSHDMYIQEYVESDRNLKRIEQKTQMICQYPGYIVEACTISLFVLLACVIALRPDGITQAIPTLGGIVFGAKRLVPPLQLIYGNWTMLASQRDATFKALDILERCSEPVARQLPKEPIPFDRSIDFVDTAFRYRPETELVLCGVNLSIPRGTRLGIKGPTGSGKSTLIDILMGLLTPTSGVIEVDGVTIDESNIRRWQTRIAHVPQAIYLADITIAENIAIGIPQSEIDMARVRDCARKARIDDYIDSLNEGYKTYVGERGVRLSGGQRQRIGIARALYKQADVIVLDEATSALDNDTEAAVMDAIDSLDRGLTLIIVAHRLSTLEKCDRIIEIRNGRAQSTLSPV